MITVHHRIRFNPVKSYCASPRDQFGPDNSYFFTMKVSSTLVLAILVAACASEDVDNHPCINGEECAGMGEYNGVEQFRTLAHVTWGKKLHRCRGWCRGGLRACGAVTDTFDEGILRCRSRVKWKQRFFFWSVEHKAFFVHSAWF